GLLPGTAPCRRRGWRRFLAHRAGPLLDGDHGHLAATARDLRQGAAFEIAQQFGGAVRLSHEQRPEPVLLLKRPGQPVEARPAPSKLAELQLLERLRHLMAANRHDIVHDGVAAPGEPDRKSTRLNSSHLGISYAVFCLKKKKKK